MLRHQWCSAGVVTLAALGGTIVFPPAPVAGRAPARTFQMWRDAVLRHDPGTADEAARTIAPWSARDLELVYNGVMPDRKHPAPPQARALIKAGAMLHADIAARVPMEPRPVGPGGPATNNLSLMGYDGKEAGVFEANTLHWEFARRLLDALGPEGADATVRLWYRATIAYSLWTSRYADGLPQTRHALQVFPSDAQILFTAGCLWEAFAAPRMQSAIKWVSLPKNYFVDVPPTPKSLAQAEAAFAKSSAADPSNAEAHIRHANVLGLMDRHAEALAELKALPPDADPVVQYYGELLLGRELAHAGEREAARAAYQRAGRLFPLAQSPVLALRNLDGSGNPGSRRALEVVLTLPPLEDERFDPWWIYHLGSGRGADVLMQALRRAILGGQNP